MPRPAGGYTAGSISLEGGAELDRKLQELPKALARKILRQAMRASAKPIAAEAKLRVRIKSGKTKAAIKVRAIKRNRRGDIGVRLTVGKGDYMGETFYASFLEYGWLSGARKKMKAATMRRVERRIRRELRAKKLLKKHGTKLREIQEQSISRQAALELKNYKEPERKFYQYPFLRPAFDAKKVEAVRIAADTIAKGILEAAKSA